MRNPFRLIHVLLWSLQPFAVLAAGSSLGSAMGMITLDDWISIVALSAVSGTVALMSRLKASLEYEAAVKRGENPPQDSRQLIDWWIFAIVHMAGAIFVGFLTFLIGQWWEMNSYLQAAFISLASWSGAKAAEKFSGAFNDRVVQIIGEKQL